MKKNSFETEAVRMLIRDHKRITDLLFHFQQSEDWNHKLSFAETALNELAIHSVIEEECVYPLLEEKDKKKLSKRVHHSRKEHEKMDELMTELGHRDRVDEFYIDLFTKLGKMITDHIEEEEEDLLPALEHMATDELARKISDLKNELLSYESNGVKDFSPRVLLIDRLQERRRSA
jgi:hemerythrin superfamily protein